MRSSTVLFIIATLPLLVIVNMSSESWRYPSPTHFQVEEHSTASLNFHEKTAHLIGTVRHDVNIQENSPLNLKLYNTCSELNNRIGVHINNWESFKGYSHIPTDNAFAKMKREYPIGSIVMIYSNSDCTFAVVHRHGVLNIFLRGVL